MHGVWILLMIAFTGDKIDNYDVALFQNYKYCTQAIDDTRKKHPDLVLKGFCIDPFKGTVIPGAGQQGSATVSNEQVL